MLWVVSICVCLYSAIALVVYTQTLLYVARVQERTCWNLEAAAAVSLARIAVFNRWSCLGSIVFLISAHPTIAWCIGSRKWFYEHRKWMRRGIHGKAQEQNAIASGGTRGTCGTSSAKVRVLVTVFLSTLSGQCTQGLCNAWSAQILLTGASTETF